MKKLICVILVGILFTGCVNKENSVINSEENIEDKVEEEKLFNDIKNYISSNINYELYELKIEEYAGKAEEYNIIATLGTNYSLDDFIPFTKKLVEISNNIPSKFEIPIKDLFLSINMNENEQFTWTSSKYLYNKDELIAKNVSLEDLENEIKKYKNKNKKIDKEESPEELKERFGDKLEPFQGEWEDIKLGMRLIISGKTVNFVHLDGLKKDKWRKVSNVHTFYFDLDESGNLIVSNAFAQPAYTLKIDENGQLIRKSINGSSDEGDIYKKVSDNTNVPNVPVEPSIGMTESEVLASKWGSPKKRNETITATGKREQWVYDKGYIYFENGYVTAIQK